MNEINDEIIDRINKSALHPEYTNCTLSLDEIEKYAKSGDISVVYADPLILLQHCNGYYQLFYFLNQTGSINELSPDALKADISDNALIYADITRKGDFVYNGSVFEKLGLLPYRTYVRKSVINQNLHFRKMLDTVYAVFDDCDCIYSMLTNQFDMMSDHIPGKTELSEIIERQQVLKIMINDKIAGVLLFDDVGKRSYARSLCVHQDYQNAFVGYSLLSDYFNRHGPDKTRLFYLWVDEKNEGVKKLHDNFGYKFDGLKNYVFRKG